MDYGVEKEGQNRPGRTLSYEYDYDSDGSSAQSSSEAYGVQESLLRTSPALRSSPRIRVRSPYHYRIPNRTMRWLCLALLLTMVVFILSLIRMSQESARQVQEGAAAHANKPPVYESFPLLKRYYGGIRTLVPTEKNEAEYPNDTTSPENFTVTKSRSPVPKSTPYLLAKKKDNLESAVECFLDDKDSINIPQIHAYSGIPAGFPRPVIGAYELFDIDNTKCFDRYGRLGPYGYGYTRRKGGTGAGLDGEREGAEETWKDRREIDYANVQWGLAQDRCYGKNKHRFNTSQTASTQDSFLEMGRRGDLEAKAILDPPGIIPNQTDAKSIGARIPRTAIVLRTWSGYDYNEENMLFLRSLISELSLFSGGEFTVHFLIHVQDDSLQIWSDPETYERVLNSSLPNEFRGMGTLWSERQMFLIYGGLDEQSSSHLPVYGVYRSAHFPLQYFAQKHPEYEYFWNLEMDVRSTGHWYEIFAAVRKWAASQPRKGLWERSGRFYVPEVHGSWEDFSQMVRVQVEMPTPAAPAKAYGPPGHAPAPPKQETPIWGPLGPNETFPSPSDPVPPTTYDKDKYTWGVGEEADLINFNPFFDPDQTNWGLKDCTTGYNLTAGLPARRAAIVTASRLSRRLLNTMHRETALGRHSMFTEMWPASCALHHGLKAVYVPHPVFVQRAWPLKYLASILNAGRNGATGGAPASVFSEDYQHQLFTASWYYKSSFSPHLWRRWLGLRGDDEGGEEWELADEGRMCVPSMLLHPIKELDIPVEGKLA